MCIYKYERTWCRALVTDRVPSARLVIHLFKRIDDCITIVFDRENTSERRNKGLRQIMNNCATHTREGWPSGPKCFPGHEANCLAQWRRRKGFGNAPAGNRNKVQLHYLRDPMAKSSISLARSARRRDGVASGRARSSLWFWRANASSGNMWRTAHFIWPPSSDTAKTLLRKTQNVKRYRSARFTRRVRVLAITAAGRRETRWPNLTASAWWPLRRVSVELSRLFCSTLAGFRAKSFGRVWNRLYETSRRAIYCFRNFFLERAFSNY